MNDTNMRGYPIVSSTYEGETYANENPKSRRIESREEQDRCEKTLHHLVGRVQELHERLDRVMNPSLPHADNSAQKDPQRAQGSILTETFRNHAHLAQQSINAIEDILDRLDV